MKNVILTFDGKFHVARVEGTEAFCLGKSREEAIGNLVIVFPYALDINKIIQPCSIKAQPYQGGKLED